MKAGDFYLVVRPWDFILMGESHPQDVGDLIGPMMADGGNQQMVRAFDRGDILPWNRLTRHWIDEADIKRPPWCNE